MTQLVHYEVAGEIRELTLPDPKHELLPGIAIGSADTLLSPAYWAVRCVAAPTIAHEFVDRGATLVEEVGFCLLGGYGVRAEVASAFFNALKCNGVFFSGANPSHKDILDLLKTPLKIGTTLQRYRFPQQRAQRLSAAIEKLSLEPPSSANHNGFRAALQDLDGIGPKTASWITRNWLDSDHVAILDIHVVRACQFIGLFEDRVRLPVEYDKRERQFLAFAAALDVRASVLDAVMWCEMRQYGSQLMRALDRI